MWLLKIITGQVSRENKVDAITMSEPITRFRKSDLFYDRFLHGIVYATTGQVRNNIRHLLWGVKVKEYQAFGKQFELDKIGRISAFLGWHSCWRAIGFLTEGIDESDDRFQYLQEKITDIATIIYPRDFRVEEAVKMFLLANQDFLDGGAKNSSFYLIERTRVIDYLAEIQTPDELSEQINRALFVDILGSWEDFQYFLDAELESDGFIKA